MRCRCNRDRRQQAQIFRLVSERELHRAADLSHVHLAEFPDDDHVRRSVMAALGASADPHLRRRAGEFLAREPCVLDRRRYDRWPHPGWPGCRRCVELRDVERSGVGQVGIVWPFWAAQRPWASSQLMTAIGVPSSWMNWMGPRKVM
jgi:hypothetical protein